MAAKPKPLKTAAAKPLRIKPVTPAVAKTLRATATPVAKTPKPHPAAPKPADPVRPVVPTAGLKSPSNADAFKKKDLIDKVVATTGAKKALVREIVEATLSALGDALSNGAMLNLPPFGKAKVSRPSDVTSGKPMTVKLRRSATGAKGAAKAKQALAAEED